jgi:hypothetical protein
VTRQWLRDVRLMIGDDAEALDVSGLRIRFAVQQEVISTPGWADITVYNLSQATVDKIDREYTKMTLEAGYEGGGRDLIFSGDITQKISGRENPTDTFLRLVAVDGAKAHWYATVNKTLAAGHTFRDQVDACLKALEPFGIVAGQIADLGAATMPRGRVLFGMVKDTLREITQATNTTWAIRDGKLNVVPNRSYLENEAIVLNSRSGLIGMPTRTFNGIEARCLLNPKIRPGGRIKIDQESIQDVPLSESYGSTAANYNVPLKSDDGFYKVLMVNHMGDTRGNEFYSDIVCIRADGEGPLPKNFTELGVTLDAD